MRDVRARSAIAWLAGVVVAAAAVLTLAVPAGASARLQQDLIVTGEVDGLYPGVTTTMNAQVTNQQAFAIRVTQATATVDDAGACSGSLLDVSGPRTPVTIAPGATGSVPLDVHLALAAPDSCQGVTFTLDLVATAEEAASDAAPGGTPASPASPAPSSPTGFAFTGAGIATLVAIALGLVGIGVVARRAGRRRHEVAA